MSLLLRIIAKQPLLLTAMIKYPGDYGYENAPVTTRYHSQTDLYYHKIMGLDSYVINRYDYSFSLAGNDPTCDKDVFLRFFLFLNY